MDSSWLDKEPIFKGVWVKPKTSKNPKASSFVQVPCFQAVLWGSLIWPERPAARGIEENQGPPTDGSVVDFLHFKLSVQGLQRGYAFWKPWKARKNLQAARDPLKPLGDGFTAVFDEI